MKKNLTEIVFILDRSGSMSGLEADTIGGFNSMIEKQKRENGEALISTVLDPWYGWWCREYEGGRDLRRGGHDAGRLEWWHLQHDPRPL